MTTQAASDITQPDASAPAAAAPATAVVTPRPPMPSVHVRAVITWLAIFPLVSIGMLALGPLMDSWHPVLRSLLLTALVVPAAVYFVVPKLMAGYGAMTRRAVERAARSSAQPN